MFGHIEADQADGPRDDQSHDRKQQDLCVVEERERYPCQQTARARKGATYCCTPKT